MSQYLSSLTAVKLFIGISEKSTKESFEDDNYSYGCFNEVSVMSEGQKENACLKMYLEGAGGWQPELIRSRSQHLNGE